jgi:hypothetical protein
VLTLGSLKVLTHVRKLLLSALDRSTNPGVLFVNIRFMFNGEMMALVRRLPPQRRGDTGRPVFWTNRLDRLR